MKHSVPVDLFSQDAPVCDHPLQDVTVAGQAVEPLLEVFHTLLQTTADVMMQLPWGSAIQVAF